MSTPKKTGFDDTQRETEKFLALLKAREVGLTTWWEAINRQRLELLESLNAEPKR